MDQPLSLNSMSLNLLFKSHITKPSTFARANAETPNDAELLKFLKNYFEHGLPIFNEDVLDSEINQIFYKSNPIEWINKFTDTQIELALSYVYLRKYIEHYYMSIVQNNKGLENVAQKLINEYGNKNIVSIKNEIHLKILSYEEQMKKQFPDVPFNYQYSKYLETGDLNTLFNICYNLFFKGMVPTLSENLYNKQKVSDLID